MDGDFTAFTIDLFPEQWDDIGDDNRKTPRFKPQRSIHMIATQGMPCDQQHGHSPQCIHRSDCQKAGYTCKAFRQWQSLKQPDLAGRIPDD